MIFTIFYDKEKVWLLHHTCRWRTWNTRWVECRDATQFPPGSDVCLLGKNMFRCLEREFLQNKKNPHYKHSQYVLQSRFVNQVMLIIKRSIDIVLFILQRNIFLQTWTGWTAFSVHTHLVVTIKSGTYHLMTENVPILKYNIGLIFSCFCKCTQQNWNYILCFNSQCFQCFCYIYVRMFFSYQWCTWHLLI